MASTKKSVEWSVKNSGTYASVYVKLPQGSQIHCESDAIVTMSGGVSIQGGMRGGFFASLARLFFTQETFFITSAKAKDKDGDLLLAANEPGDIMLHQLHPDEDLLLTRGSYVAADTSVNFTTKLQKHVANARLSGTGLFLIRAYGSGTLACSSFGAIHRFVLAEGEERAVDNGHLIAWTASMKYRVGKAASSLTGTLTSGEGIMLHFQGPGTLYVQSHTPKVELLPAAASPRKRKGRSILFLVLLVILFVIGVNIFFFVMKIKQSDADADAGEL